MAWSYDFPKAEAGAERAFRLPMGVASPLWAVFGAAAGVGIAYWWMTSWTRMVNIEALAGAAPEPVTAPEPVAVAVESAILAQETVAEIAQDVAETVVAAAELALAEPPAAADDLTRMTGVGPKLSLALAGHGVTRFAQIADWTADDLAAFDAALALKGRAVREAWVAQAKRLAGHA